MNYKRFYDRISAPLRSYAKVLEGLNKLITRTFYLLFPIISYLGLAKDGWFVLSTTVLIMGGGFFPSFSWVVASTIDRVHTRPGLFNPLLRRTVWASPFLVGMFSQRLSLLCWR